MTSPGLPQGMDVRPDLHLHSIFSDGLLAPGDLCALAAQAGLTHIALCDHDTLRGILPMQEAVRAHNAEKTEGAPLVFLTGVEVSAGAEGQIHILGYGARPEHPALLAWAEGARARRKERFHEMLQRLSTMGLDIPRELLPPWEADEHLGRAHLARALVSMGAIHTMEQAFSRLLGEGRPAYIPYAHMSAAEAVRFLREARCVPALAHPARLPMDGQARRALIHSLTREGLMGLEVYHPSASRRDIREMESLAREAKLLVTGGSDYHGDQGAHARMGGLPGKWTNAAQDIHALMSAITNA